MLEWDETQQAVRSAVRRFIEAEVRPKLAELEHGSAPPYEVLRKFGSTFGLPDLARVQFEQALRRAESPRGDEPGHERPARREPSAEAAMALAFQLIPVIELSRCSMGLVCALGVSAGLTPKFILSKGTRRQKERWALPLMTLEKIGAWALTEPHSGSDAFGAMKATARRDGNGGYILNGSKTFITNGPYADTIVFICKLDDGGDPAARKVVSFVLDSGMPGLTQSAPLRKMGLHSSPTGELFLDDVRVEKERLLGETEDAQTRSDAKDAFTMERGGVPAMALGIVEECLERCVEYARTRVQFGRPIGEFQLIQLKLAKMQVAQMNLKNLVFREIELAGVRKSMTLAEASAAKLYAAQAAVEVALEAVQLFGGNGYMAEYHVEQLLRDAKVLQIFAGTDEIQVSQIARSLLGST